MNSSSKAPSDPPKRPSLSSELDLALGDGGDVGSEPVTAFLVGLTGNNAGKLYRIPVGESVVGRSSKAFLTLQDKGVSYQHARLKLSSSGCTISDMESTNGTRVNDVRIEGPQDLHAGDVIRFGQATLGYLTDADDEQQHTRALARVNHTHRGLISDPPPSIGGGHTDATRGATNPAEIIRAPLTAEHAIVSSHPQIVSEAPPPPTAKLDEWLDKGLIVWRFLAQNAWLIIFATLTVAILAAATVALRPPMATAQFEVFLRDDPKGRGQTNYAPHQVGFFEFAEKDFISPDLVKETLEALNLPAHPGAVDASARRLSLSQIKRSSYFQGSYVHSSPEFAKRFLTVHLKNFLEYEISEAIATKLDNVKLLRKQYEENHKRLVALEEDLKDFKMEHPKAQPGRAGATIAGEAGLRAQRDQLTAQLDRYQKELRLAQERLNSGDLTPTTTVDRVTSYERALTSIRQEIVAAKANGWSEEHPELKRLRQQETELELLKKQAESTDPSTFEAQTNPEYRALKNRVGDLRVAVSATQKELGLVQGRLGEINDLAATLPEIEVKLSEKMRQVEASKRLHEDLFTELRARELDLELERNNVRARYEVMTSPHTIVPSQVKSATKRAVMGGGFGFLLAIGFALARWLVRYAKNRNRIVVPPTAAVSVSREEI